MTEITLFRFENKPVNVLKDEAGELWFNASDVCRNLELSNVTMALRVLDADEKGLKTVETLGGEQQVNCVSEPGLYKLISRSRKPEAKRFDRWVRHDVLPQIRKTGSYSAVPAIDLNDPAFLRQTLLGYTEKVIALEAEVSILSPKAERLDILAKGEGDVGVQDAGRVLGVGQTWVVNYVLDHDWACRQKKRLKAAHYGLSKGYVRACSDTYIDRYTGETKVRDDFKITRKGIDRLAEIIVETKKANDKVAEMKKAMTPSREMELH